jgi:hypothetical protein
MSGQGEQTSELYFASSVSASLKTSVSYRIVEIGQSEINISAPLSSRLVQGFRFQRHAASEPQLMPEIDEMDRESH